MIKFVQMVHETKENLLWLLQGFVKGEDFFFTYCDFYFSSKYSQPKVTRKKKLNQSKSNVKNCLYPRL